MFIINTIRKNGLDMNLKINLGSNSGLIGYQQEIDNLTQATALELVNPVLDVEKRRFKLATGLAKFQFTFNGGASFLNAGFTQDEIDSHTLNMLNSFFILDYYTTYNPNTQIKIFTTYLTKIGSTPIYNISANTGNQLYYWYVPVSYIDAQTGTTAFGYVKLSFYNAKTGNIVPFYNNDNAAAPIGLTPEKLYFPAQLNIYSRSWRIVTPSNTVIDARELVNSTSYNTRIDNTFNKLDNIKQKYPSGSTYNYKTNTYITQSGGTTI